MFYDEASGVGRFGVLASLFPEEALHEFGAFIGHHTACDLGSRVQGLRCETLETALFIGRSIDDSADL